MHSKCLWTCGFMGYVDHWWRASISLSNLVSLKFCQSVLLYFLTTARLSILRWRALGGTRSWRVNPKIYLSGMSSSSPLWSPPNFPNARYDPPTPTIVKEVYMPSIGSERDLLHVTGGAEVCCSLITSSIPTSEKNASTSFIQLFQSPITISCSPCACASLIACFKSTQNWRLGQLRIPCNNRPCICCA